MPPDPPDPPGRETSTLSARARALLDEIERLAAVGRQQLRVGRPHHATPARAPAGREPELPAAAARWPTPASAGATVSRPAPPGWQEPGAASSLGEERVGASAFEGAETEARMQELIDAVGHRAESMRGTLDDLGRILEGLEQRLSAMTRRVSDAGASRITERPPEPPLPPTDSARLVAIEMAVAGSTRREVALRLLGEFGVRNPDPILDDVFGPGTGADTRMPWSGG